MQPHQVREYEEFVTATWGRMVRYAHAITGSRTDAEDAVQTAYAKAYSSWRRVQRADHPEAYVRRMVTNEVANGWRRRWRHVEHSTDQVPDVVAPSHDDDVADADLVWRSLQRLTPRQRAVLVLRYYEDLSERDIAETLGISPGTVKSRASHALKALRHHLGDRAVAALPEGTNA